MNRNELSDWVERLRGRRVLVVGDVIHDIYIYGDADRLSPEAPVPVVAVEREDERLGGAANVAKNLVTLGAEPQLVGVVGEDEYAERVRANLESAGIRADGLVSVVGRHTGVKTRVVCRGQQVVRIDRETVAPVTPEEVKRISDYLAEVATTADALIFSDYGKGVLHAAAMQAYRARLPEHLYTVVDPIPAHMEAYGSAAVATPNRREAHTALGFDPREHVSGFELAERLLQRFPLEEILVTLGPEGLVWQTRGGEPARVPTEARQVYDVSGAGDTVVAVVATARGAGASLEVAARLANAAAGVVVGKSGTASVTPAELVERLRQAD